MTMAVSAATCLEAGPPPLEILFKGKTRRTIAGCVKPPSCPHLSLSITFAERGSDRLEHVLAYLERHLEPWTAKRAHTDDWRILLLDAFKPHMDPAVKELALTRGYIVILHGGGTACVGQVNDTDIHEPFFLLNT